MMRDLLENEGIFLRDQTVRKYMNVDLGLKAIVRKKKKHYSAKSTESYRVFDDLIQRNFTAVSRNEKWLIDFTYLTLSKG